jgi:glycosyltransferase involved in cell wall biosynthesis
LCFIPDGFGGHGGIAQFNRDLLTALSLSPHVAEIVALPRHVVGDVGALPDKITFDIGAAGGKLRFAVRALSRLARDRAFDLVISTHINLQPLALLAARLTGAPSVLVLHGVDAWTRPRSVLRRHAARGADQYVAVSRLTLERFFAWAGATGAEGSVLPCCVDLDRFTPGVPDPAVAAKYGLGGRTPLLTLARLSASERYKGIDEVVEIVAALRREIPDFLYVVAGSGDDRARLEAKVQALGVADAVRFTGYVPEDEKRDLYRAAHGFILAGRGEGFGIVLLEAMACGVPAIASSRDGSREAVRDGQLGAVVDPADQRALTRAIIEALRRPQGVRPPGLDHFGFQRFAERVDELVRRTAAPAIAGRKNSSARH